jgi:hypothetical protein
LTCPAGISCRDFLRCRCPLRAKRVCHRFSPTEKTVAPTSANQPAYA